VFGFDSGLAHASFLPFLLMQNRNWISLYYAMLASAKISQGVNQQFFTPVPLFWCKRLQAPRKFMLSKLLIITTGGTIDKIYFDDESDYQIGESQISQILSAMHVAFEFEVRSVMRKDSLHMEDKDRKLIHDVVSANATRHVLITHGTDSIVDTAIVLQNLPDKTIVLTGALNPARFRDSDAIFNIGCAIGAAQALPPGVYITMNGMVWDPAHVRKNRRENRFEYV